MQQSLRDTFDECTKQFVNKKYWIQLQYKTQEMHDRILIMIRIFRGDADYPVMKAALYCTCSSDVYFLKEYLSGLVLTLAVD